MIRNMEKDITIDAEDNIDTEEIKKNCNVVPHITS